MIDPKPFEAYREAAELHAGGLPEDVPYPALPSFLGECQVQIAFYNDAVEAMAKLRREMLDMSLSDFDLARGRVWAYLLSGHLEAGEHRLRGQQLFKTFEVLLHACESISELRWTAQLAMMMGAPSEVVDPPEVLQELALRRDSLRKAFREARYCLVRTGATAYPGADPTPLLAVIDAYLEANP